MKSLFTALLLSACLCFGQQTSSPADQNSQRKPANPASGTEVTPSKAAQNSAQKDAEGQKPESQKPESQKEDKAAAYYHFTLAHTYEEQMAVYGRSDLMTKAIQEYRLAIQADPSSQYLTAGLAEL